MATPMPREMIRWIQTLDLPLPLKQPKRDLANGYLFGEIVARYWEGVELHSLENKLSRKEKEANWKILRRVFMRNGVRVAEEQVLAIIECSDGAAQALLEQLYMVLTRRQLQFASPLQEAEVPIPSFTRPSEQRGAQPHVGMGRGGEAASPAAVRMKEVDEEQHRRAEQQQQQQRQEEQQRYQARRVAQSRAKPKLATRSSTIRAAADEEESTGPQVHFSAVAVKPLPPQLLSRFGGGGSGNGRRDSTTGGSTRRGGGGEGGSGAEGNAHETVLTTLSAQLERVLVETRNPPFPQTQSAPTAVEFFAQNVAVIEPSLKALLWSALMKGVAEVADWLLGRPLDVPMLLKVHSCLASAADSHAADTAAARFDAAPQSDFQQHVLHLSAIFTVMGQRSAFTALAALRRHVLPFLHPILLLPRHHPRFHVACAILKHFLPPPGDASSADTGAGDPASAVLSAIHEFTARESFADSSLPAAAADGTSDAAAAAAMPSRAGSSSRGFVTFVNIQHRLVELLSDGAARQGNRRMPWGAAAAVPGNNSSDDVRAAAAAAALWAPRPTGSTLRSETLASVAYYNCVSGLHSESATARAAATHLLATLTAAGRGRMLFDAHLGILELQFGTREAAAQVGHVDVFLARVSLLLNAVLHAPAVFSTLCLEAQQQQQQQQERQRHQEGDGDAPPDTRSRTGSSEGDSLEGEGAGVAPDIGVTEPSITSPTPSAGQMTAVPACEAQMTAATNSLHRYVRNLTDAVTSTATSMSWGVREHVARVIAATLRTLSASPTTLAPMCGLVPACMPALVSFFLHSDPAQFARLSSAAGALRTPLLGTVRGAPLQHLWPPLPAVQELTRIGVEAVRAAGLADKYASPSSASRHLQSVVSAAIKADRVSGDAMAEMLGTTAFLARWAHLLCVTNRGGSGTPLVLLTARFMPQSSEVSPARSEGDAEQHWRDERFANEGCGDDCSDASGRGALEEAANDEMTQWWGVMGALAPHFVALQYIADLQHSAVARAAQSGGGGGGGEQAAAAAAAAALRHLSGLVTDCMVRFYLDLSGVQAHTPASSGATELGGVASVFEDEATRAKARDWFTSVVATTVPSP